MDYMANNEKSWTLHMMFEALFDYRFPMDYKDRLQAKSSQPVRGK